MRRVKVLCAVVCLLIAACATSGYAEASQEYATRAAAYHNAGDVIQNLRTVGRVSDAQWSQFQADTAEARAADVDVFADLTAWRDSGKKPSGYDAHLKRLTDAQNSVIALSQAVHL